MAQKTLDKQCRAKMREHESNEGSAEVKKAHTKSRTPLHKPIIVIKRSQTFAESLLLLCTPAQCTGKVQCKIFSNAHSPCIYYTYRLCSEILKDQFKSLYRPEYTDAPCSSKVSERRTEKRKKLEAVSQEKKS